MVTVNQGTESSYGNMEAPPAQRLDNEVNEPSTEIPKLIGGRSHLKSLPMHRWQAFEPISNALGGQWRRLPSPPTYGEILKKASAERPNHIDTITWLGKDADN